MSMPLSTLRKNYAERVLGQLSLDRSDLVRGFMTKCATGGTPPDQVLGMIRDAIRMHPAIAAEFEKCGMTKQAIGGPGMMAAGPIMDAGGGAPPKLGTPPGGAPPKLGAPPGGAPPHPAVPPPPPPPQRNALGQGLHNVSNLAVGTGTALGGGLGTLGGGLWSLGARATDGLGLTKNQTPAADAFTGTMAKATQTGVSTGLAGLTNQDPKAMADYMSGGIYGDVQTIPEMTRGHMQQLQDGGGVELPGGYKLDGPQSSGIYNTLTGTGHDAANMVPAALGGTALRPVLGYQAATSTPASAIPAGVEAALDAPSFGEIPGQTLANMPKYQTGSQYGLPDANSQPEATTQPSAAPESAVTQTPMYEKIMGFVQQMPEKAQELGQQAMNQLASTFQTKPGQAEAMNVKANGTLTPDGQQKALTALTSEGYDWKQAGQLFQNMNGWEQLGLWGGIGLSALGLLHALSGEGGIGSIIMALTGLGVAGAAAGHGGLLNQGAQDFTHGMAGKAQQMIGSMMPSGQSAAAPPAAAGKGGMNIPPEALKQMMPTMMQHAPDEAVNWMLSQTSPDQAKMLDQAAGTGGMGNAFLSWLGDVSGRRQHMMKDQLGLDPQGQDRMLKLWAARRAQRQ